MIDRRNYRYHLRFAGRALRRKWVQVRLYVYLGVPAAAAAYWYLP